MENETDEVVSGVTTLSMAVEQSGPLSFADILDLGAEVAGRLADQHEDGEAHGHVAPGAIVRLEDGPWRLAPSALIPDLEPLRAPELAAGDDPTQAGDVYALGATLSFGLTGAEVEPAPTEAATGPTPDGPDAVDGPDPAAGPEPVGADPEPAPADGATASTVADDAGDADEGDGPAAEPADDLGDPTAEISAIDLTDEAAGATMTLPEVMTSFLVVLRSSLAAEPEARPSASSLAATLRQLRSDADTALGGALVGAAAAGGIAAVTIGDGSAAAEPWGAPLYDVDPVEPGAEPIAAAGVGAAAAAGGAAGDLTVEGTGSAASLTTPTTKKKKSLKERGPLIVAAAALLIAAFLGVSLVRERNDKTSDLLATGPTVGTTVRRTTTTTAVPVPVETIVETTTTLASTTTSSTSTTAPRVEETVPDTTAPTTTAPTTTVPTTAVETTTTLPPTTTTQPAVNVKVVKVTCATPPNAGNPCRLFASADVTSEPRSEPLSAATPQLQATCVKSAPPPPPGTTVDTWVYIIGPAPTYAGWLSASHLGGSIPVLPACPATQNP